MQYDIDGGNITVVVGEEARMDVPTALNYIKSGQYEIETTVNAGIDAFDLNAANKTTDYNDNASAKVTTYNNNASAKLTAYNDNATSKTGDFNDNYTIKKAAVDASADAASASATLAQQWAVKMDGKVADEDYSAKYYADLASQSAGATGANKDLSNLTAAGEARFTAKQDVISDLSTIRSGAALGDTSVQLSGAQTITGAKSFSKQVITGAGEGVKFNGTNHYYTMRSAGNPYEGLGLFLDNDANKSALTAYVDKIVIGSSSLPAYAITPTDTTATNGTQIATTGWVNSTNNNVVHRTGNETIAGTKTFTASPYVNNAQPKMILKSSTITKGTAPASYTEVGFVSFGDKNDETLGRLRYYYNQDKSSVIQMTAYQANSSGDSNSASIRVVYPASGGSYATAPASSVANSIVTTVSATKNTRGAFSYGNGMIVNFYSSTTDEASGTTFTFREPFTSATSYGVACTGTNSGQYLDTSFKTATNFKILSNASGKRTYVAIGY